MDFVGCHSVPHKEFAVLRGRHQMGFVLGPLHGVDLRQVTLEGTPDLNLDLAARGHRGRRVLHCFVIFGVALLLDLLLQLLSLLLQSIDLI